MASIPHILTGLPSTACSSSLATINPSILLLVLEFFTFESREDYSLSFDHLESLWWHLEFSKITRKKKLKWICVNLKRYLTMNENRRECEKTGENMRDFTRIYKQSGRLHSCSWLKILQPWLSIPLLLFYFYFHFFCLRLVIACRLVS